MLIAGPTATAGHRTQADFVGHIGTRLLILAVYDNQPLHARDLAHHLGLTARQSIRNLTSQLCLWTRHNLLTRTAPSTYKITPPDTLTPPHVP